MNKKKEKISEKKIQGLILKPRRISFISHQNAVKIAKSFNRKFSPVNCSMNSKTDGHDIDRMIEVSRRRELNFNNSISKELKKLSISSSPTTKTHRNFYSSESPVTVRASDMEDNFFYKIKEPSIEDIQVNLPIITPVKITPYTPSNASPARSEFLLPGTPKRRFSSFEDPESLPPPIKLVPIKNKEKQNKRIIKHDRIKSLEALVDTCNIFEPIIKPKIKEVIHEEKERNAEISGFLHYVNDLSDILRIAPDEGAFSNFMSTRRYNKKLDKGLKSDLSNTKEELFSITKKLIEMGGRKIWRHRQASFMASTDKEINSFPAIKYR
ncbi:unnamed protein product [Blepharisma stoltei]|uniref:Uncharacterized protein n=1 Tax=Blepharisma stoltei TaxID=1481888 RepID=A0AAU9ICM9_9CILI|nr:unnamed protein product [Blepharisma stoltei]